MYFENVLRINAVTRVPLPLSGMYREFRQVKIWRFRVTLEQILSMMLLVTG